MFALGSLLYALVTGSSPFAQPKGSPEGSVMELLRRLIAVEYEPISRVLDPSFEDVDRILASCLQRYPGRR